MKACGNCGARARPGRRECSACAEYRRTHGFPRPEHTIIAHGQRLLERAEFAHIVRQIVLSYA